MKVEDLARQFGIMSMNQMATYHVLLETYKIMNFGSSEKIRDKLTPANSYSRHLTVPLFKKNACRSFSFYSSRLWNTLPMDVGVKAIRKDTITDKQEENRKLHSFKKEIKSWILNGGVPFR